MQGNEILGPQVWFSASPIFRMTLKIKVLSPCVLRGMFEKNCLFLSGDFKIQVGPKVFISCPRSTLPVVRNAKFQPMYLLLECVMVRRFGHSNKVLRHGRSKCLSGLVFPPSKE